MEDSGDFRSRIVFDHEPVALKLMWSHFTDATTVVVLLAGHAIILSRKEVGELIDWLVEQRERDSNRK